MVKRFIWVVLLLLLLAAAGCGKSRIYDVENGVDPEVTLFEKSLVVPVGSAGPFTLELAKQPIGDFLSTLGFSQDLVTADENNQMQLSLTEDFVTQNLYKLALSMEENEDPYVWEPDVYPCMPALGLLLSYFSILTHRQQINLYVTSALRSAVPVKGSLDVTCLNEDYEPTYMDAMDLDVTLPSNVRHRLLVSYQLPESLTGSVPSVSFSDLEVTLPARYSRRIENEGVFSIQLEYKTNISVGEGFNMVLPEITIPVNLPLGKIGFNHADIKLELESTLPIQITLDKLAVPDNENLSITAEGVLEGGSEGSPVTSGLTLHIETLDGQPIPDITSLLVNGTLKAVPGLENVLLSFNQGLYLKHSSIKVIGGINLFGHED